jgi:AbiV family abortive infection protein
MPKRFCNEFFDLYHAAHENAVDLLEEADILFDAGKFARAYALGFTALEEISKSQLAADVSTGLITKEEFQEHYRDHRKKIDRMAWATEDARRYLDAPEGDYVRVENPSFANRMDAMYVSINGQRVIPPSDVIDAEAARGIIHTGKVAVQRIWEITEYYGHRIGTKSFMK